MADQDLSREETRVAQTNELYRAIGEFAVAFEQANHEIWSCVAWLLQAAGLKGRNITQILLAKHTADPLRETLRSLVAEMRPKNVAEEKIVANIINRHAKLTEKRNDILHGVWHIGYGNESTTDWSMASGMKLDRDGKGANLKPFNWQAADFDELTAKANDLRDCFMRLSGCFTFDHVVEKNFDVDKDGRVSVPSSSN